MSSKMKSYSDYKETGLLWLERIPSHWELTRNKNVMKLKKGIVGSDYNQYTLLSLTLKGIIPRDIESGKGKFPKDFTNYQIVNENDLVFCLFDIDETPRTVGLSSLKGMITGAYTIFMSDINTNHNPKYIYYYYLSLDQNKALKPLYTGLRKVINVDTFLRTKLPLPTLLEQNQIVKYLDYQLGKINKFINAKKKLISVLKEQKQAVINEAVTKGLNPNVKLKPSGIDWLGNIPDHWEVKPLRQLLRPLSIKNRPDLPLLSIVREKGVILRSSMSKEENHNFIPDDLSGYKVVKNGQFAMNKMKAWQGSYGVSPYHGIVSPAYYIFDLNFENKDYFHYAIRSKVYVNFFYQASDGIRVGQWDLSLDKMKEIPFFVPPEDEQKEILEYIPKEFKRIDDAVERLQKEIDLIEEYRVRLISDVVTGKVDVRNIKIGNFQNEELDDAIDEDIFELEEVLEDEECEV